MKTRTKLTVRSLAAVLGLLRCFPVTAGEANPHWQAGPLTSHTRAEASAKEMGQPGDTAKKEAAADVGIMSRLENAQDRAAIDILLYEHESGDGAAKSRDSVIEILGEIDTALQSCPDDDIFKLQNDYLVIAFGLADAALRKGDLDEAGRLYRVILSKPWGRNFTGVPDRARSGTDEVRAKR